MTALAAGTIIAETYQLVQPIGRGGMGVVWRARHLRLPREVAIKVMAPHGDERADADGLARFRHEAEIVARLAHPGIVRVLDFNSLPGFGPYIVMELLAGESLHARLGRGPLPPADVLAILRQVGPALDAAHRLGVVHRDLKPENLFLVADPPSAKVLDFGVSKIRGSDTVRTHNDVMLGTPQYMAPEQASGDNAALDQRADLFALAAIVYEMLVGEGAFEGANLAAITYKIVHGQAPDLAARAPWLPASVVAAVARGLAKSREQRFPDVPSFVAALSELASTAPGPIAPARLTESQSAQTRVARKAASRPLAAEPSPSPTGPRRRRQWQTLAFLLATGVGAIALAMTSHGLQLPSETTITFGPRAVATPGHWPPTPAPAAPRAVAPTPAVALTPPPERAAASPLPAAPPAPAPSRSEPRPLAARAPRRPAAPPSTAPTRPTPAPVVATAPLPAVEPASEPEPADAPPHPVTVIPPDPGALPREAWITKVQAQLSAMTSLESCVPSVHAAAPAALEAGFSDAFEFAHGRVVSAQATLWPHLYGKDGIVELRDQLPFARSLVLERAVSACVTAKLATVHFPPIDVHTLRADFTHVTRLR